MFFDWGNKGKDCESCTWLCDNSSYNCSSLLYSLRSSPFSRNTVKSLFNESLGSAFRSLKRGSIIETSQKLNFIGNTISEFLSKIPEKKPFVKYKFR